MLASPASLSRLYEDDSPISAELERRLLAATLNALAEWLGQQSELLSDADTYREADPRVIKLVSSTCSQRRRQARLTRREAQVAELIARGWSNRQIAEDLVIATSTTERHVANILTKLGMRSRSQVAAWAVENGL